MLRCCCHVVVICRCCVDCYCLFARHDHTQPVMVCEVFPVKGANKKTTENKQEEKSNVRRVGWLVWSGWLDCLFVLLGKFVGLLGSFVLTLCWCSFVVFWCCFYYVVGVTLVARAILFGG